MVKLGRWTSNLIDVIGKYREWNNVNGNRRISFIYRKQHDSGKHISSIHGYTQVYSGG